MKLEFDLSAIPAWLICVVLVLMGLSAAMRIVNTLLRIRLKKKALEAHKLAPALKLARFAIENRGCICNEAGHRCATNQLLEDLEKLES